MKVQTAGQRTGAAAVEFAFLFPFVFAIFFAFIEHGRFTMMADLVQNAAREGARYAAVTVNDSSITTTDITNWVTKWMVGQNSQLTGFTVTVFATDSTGANLGNWKSLQYGQMIAVRIQGTYKPIVPLTLPIYGAQISANIFATSVDMDYRAVSVAESN